MLNYDSTWCKFLPCYTSGALDSLADLDKAEEVFGDDPCFDSL
jgi:hypothetical protein